MNSSKDIEVKNVVTYLGARISNTENIIAEIKRRITIAKFKVVKNMERPTY